jgi:site-specific DNA-adenine methylase
MGKRSLAEAAARRACARVSEERLLITGATLQAAARGATAEGARRALRGLCNSGVLLRVGRDQYVLADPGGAELRRTTPTTVFPWWGSKKKALGLLVAIVRGEMARAKATAVVAPFVGTGIVEGALRNQGVAVRAFDKDPNVVNMHVALSTPARRKRLCAHFRREVGVLRRCKRDERHRRFKRLLRDDVLASRQSRGAPLQAARWLLGTKCAFYGMLRNRSTLVEERLDCLRVGPICEAIKAHRGVGSRCKRGDVFDIVKEVASKRRDTLLFLDPPYLVEDGERQYQAGDFTLQQHQALAKALRGRSFVLCHREDGRIRQLYSDCEIIRLPAIMNINAAGKRPEELVIIGRAGAAP